jgi:DNA-binding transcriptional regulator WhiA
MLKNNSDITFSESVKDELSRIKYSPAEMAIILRSFLLNNLVISMSNTQK